MMNVYLPRNKEETAPEKHPGEIQKEIYQEWANLGFGRDVTLEETGNFGSKGILLPIFSAKVDGNNVKISRFANNFYSTFIGIEFEKPLPVMFMYPISGVLSEDLPISSHIDFSFSPIENFQLLYHTRKKAKRIGLETGLGRDILIPSVIRYFDTVSRLSTDKIFEIVLDKTRHGKKKHICRDAIELEKLAQELRLPLRNSPDNEVELSKNSIFERLILNESDRDLGESSIQIEMKDVEPLPYLTTPYDALYFETSKQMQDLGLRQWANCISFNTRNDEQIEERKRVDLTGTVACQYKAAEWSSRKFRIRTPNVLDTSLTALYLEKVVSPLVNDVREKYPDRNSRITSN